jgi:hypothetical protein
MRLEQRCAGIARRPRARIDGPAPENSIRAHRTLSYEHAMNLTLAGLTVAVALFTGGTGRGVSPDVKATLDSWAPSAESANYPVAVLKFTNASKKTCTVTRYQLHWSEGTFEGKPKDLVVAPGKTVEHRASLREYTAPSDKAAVVQVWEADCK